MLDNLTHFIKHPQKGFVIIGGIMLCVGLVLEIISSVLGQLEAGNHVQVQAAQAAGPEAKVTAGSDDGGWSSLR